MQKLPDSGFTRNDGAAMPSGSSRYHATMRQHQKQPLTIDTSKRSYNATNPGLNLPQISMRRTVKEMSDQMMGSRFDENCNLNRKALMIEKAHRLGETRAKPQQLDEEVSPRGGGASIETHLKAEMERRRKLSQQQQQIPRGGQANVTLQQRSTQEGGYASKTTRRTGRINLEELQRLRAVKKTAKNSNKADTNSAIKTRYSGAEIEARHSSVQHISQRRNYQKLVDTTLMSSTNNRSPMVAGLTYKYSPNMVQQNQKIGRLFPSYGIHDTKIAYQTTRKLYDVPNQQLVLEASNSDKLYFKQKFFMKDFMEELIRSNVNPNKRDS